MAKIKETKTTYSAEPITVVTTRGTTEIPRALRERYRVTAKSRLRWTDTGNGLLVVPVAAPSVSKIGMRQVANPTPTYKSSRQSKREFLAWLDEWMKEPDDWTPEQWDEFERELRTNRVKFRDTEI
jgi:bifunctional DNA-binding transcriptional regulator/antitoxin component of YhaV-PrlF toxin-antitoxin module